ncbi:hypothetical protein AOC19_06200 [Polynucleobacter asymbioticus]|uniref:hypothetical protein n=1 Tax=Polynucleobacter asymbioticus TaxID=576611 RepID=UPI001BFD3439|nr:hypothetical protein [Polynucleobacter asymbioticus]QWD84756.1 hypothetical protein AOC19_06200 [Polynucleobacter asymbioticus]
MKPEYLEPWKQIYPTKTELTKAWSDWFQSKTDEWELFTMTVVFKSGGKVARPDKWCSEYKTRVLQKIRRAIEPNQKNQELAIPFEEFFYYEKDDSPFYRVSRSHKPHHIHSLIPIRKSQVYRFWSIDKNDLKRKIKKDLNSIKTIQSVDVERIKPDQTIDWISYILKGKSI